MLISLDDLRADRLSSYGNPRPTSPFLDRLASEGFRFEHATCPANWTLPSHMSLFTGLYAFRHGVNRHTLALSDAVPSLVEAFPIAGYRTAAITGGGYLRTEYGFDRGFESFHAAAALSGQLPDNLRRAREWLTEHDEENVFLFLHTYEIHEPFLPPQEYVDRFLPSPQTAATGEMHNLRELEQRGATPLEAEETLARYDAGIRYTDDLLAEWFEKLEQAGLTENLLLIITSDHGEQFWEHGHAGHGRNFLGSELTDIPLIVRMPEGARTGEVVDDQVSFLDVMPTLLDAAGIPVPAGLDGASLLPPLTAAPIHPRDAETWGRRTATVDGRTTPVFLCEGLTFRAIGDDRWKGIFRQARLTKRLKESPRLYDLRQDPRELEPLPLKGPVVEALRVALDGIWTGESNAAQSLQAEPDEQAAQQLQALGY